jgi:K+-sensing histidine kinase KdpD
MILVEHQEKTVEGQLVNFIRVSVTDSGLGIKKKD